MFDQILQTLEKEAAPALMAKLGLDQEQASVGHMMMRPAKGKASLWRWIRGWTTSPNLFNNSGHHRCRWYPGQGRFVAPEQTHRPSGLGRQ